MKKASIVMSLVVLILTCTHMGTNDETNTSISARIFESDGKTPSVGATVKVFKSTATDRVAVAVLYTDANGKYELKGLTSGTYNVCASNISSLAKRLAKETAANDSDVSFQSSVTVSGTGSNLKNDTLTCPSTLTGYVKIQPQDNPQAITVQVVGTDKYFENTDINGKFVMSGMAAGTYSLLFKSTLTNYTPTTAVATVNSCAGDTLKDSCRIIFTGIPVVLGITATYDTLNGVVHLKWNSAAYRDLSAYLIYRDSVNAITLSASPLAVSSDTTFTDTIFKKSLASGAFSFSDPNNYQYSYRVAIRNNVNTIGQTYKGVDVVAASPTNLSTNMFKPATLAAAFSPRVAHASVVFNNKMWVIGGEDTGNGTSQFVKDVWSSNDGITWTEATASAAFPERYGHTCVAFNNKMWVISGSEYGIQGYNDVWSSSDGITWMMVTDSVSWTGRWNHTSVVFDNKIWIIGGYYYSGNWLKDVWYSSDGITWSQATDSAAFSGREGHSSVVFNNKMWVIGGRDSIWTAKNDVWSSSDGITWTQVTASAAFAGRYLHTSVVYDNKMWVIGGQDNRSGQAQYFNDAWYSSDGITWTQYTSSAGFPIRYGHTSVVYNNEMWVIGGQGSTSRKNDVWYSGVQVP